MEIVKLEVLAIEQVANEAKKNDLQELLDVQLALIGGGIGEVIVG